jgi:hypothetical protein
MDNSISYSKAISELHKAIVELNYNNKMDIHNLHRSVSTHRQTIGNINSVIDGTAFRSSSIEDKTLSLRLITIQNPEGLNTNDNLIGGEWGITYGGRDLSLEEDNYCWIVTNRKSGLKGYYIIERELIQRDWLNVRWGKTPVSSKERKEVIDKKRLRNKDIIQRDMITAILRGK